MIVSSIVATSLNHAIGKDNKLLWHLPADLKFFKATTMGCPVIMGRKTFQSIGRKLPGRQNVVITRDKTFNSDKQFDLIVVGSMDEALVKLHAAPEVFIIGGGEIYKQSMDIVDNIYLTVVKIHLDGDVYFPEINMNEFHLVWEEEHNADEKNELDYTFQKFERK
jgi:dihydrofolate reductase